MDPFNLKPAKIKFDNLWKIEEKIVTSKHRREYEICKATKLQWSLPLSSEIVYEDKQQIIIEPRNK